VVTGANGQPQPSPARYTLDRSTDRCSSRCQAYGRRGSRSKSRFGAGVMALMGRVQVDRHVLREPAGPSHWRARNSLSTTRNAQPSVGPIFRADGERRRDGQSRWRRIGISGQLPMITAQRRRMSKCAVLSDRRLDNAK
jgi:hypothetical protein